MTQHLKNLVLGLKLLFPEPNFFNGQNKFIETSFYVIIFCGITE